MENSYEEKICEAIEYIVQKAVNSAPYDRTIEATIIKCVDSTIGKYQVKYQDSKFYAYATNSNTTFSNNSLVYVLIPSNDMKRDKTILGTVEKLGVDYAVQPEGDEAYEFLGSNCIKDTDTVFKMCSYRAGSYEYILYDKKSNINRIQVNTKDLQEYITKSSSLLCGGIFKTSLPKEQRFKGNYGILFELAFMDNAAGKVVNRDYVIDVNQMTGNPYNLTTETRQYNIFEIDGANFQYLNKISIFCYDFPNTATGKEDDIFIKGIEFFGVKRLDSQDLSGCLLTFNTPSGTYFDSNDLENATRKIEAQVRVKGKVIDKDSQNLKYYWYKENLSIVPASLKYNKYGGQGWECLNNYNLIRAASNGNPAVVEWVPGKFSMSVSKKANIAKSNKYKCVAIYNKDTILSKEIEIINYSSNYEITIESDSGEQFYYDIGNPTLTCKVNNTSAAITNYTYVWAKVDNNGKYTSLPETTEKNTQYNNAVTSYNNLLQQIKNETKLPAASQNELNEYKRIIDNYDTITRVEKNKLYKVQISEITNFSNYKCAVYNNGTYLGTANITLINNLEKKDAYSLVINNGSQVFKYNENGIAPTSKSLENPLILEPLSFDIYDNLGNQLDDSILEKCNIKWIVPTKNTMISIPSSYIGNRTAVDLINNTETYSRLLTISYNINDNYNIKYGNNNIKLIVEYKGMSLTAQTDFTFAKEGEPGTNGTEFLCRIVPNVAENIAPLYPMILNGGLNYTPRQANKWFNIQLWHNGLKIFENYESGNSEEGKSVVVTWSILRNKYNTNTYDNTDININATNGSCSYSGYENNSSPANIIKCTITYGGQSYYATLPIITAKANNGYTIKLKDYSGFRYVLYTADGRRPQYDNSNPFELKVTQKINGYDEDISTLSNTYSIDYSWNIRGKRYNPSTKEWDARAYLILENQSGLEKNQYNVKPADAYNGECLNIGLECIITRNTTELGRIHIPIHFLLNKYGHAAINGWDGNSISIDKDGSGVILAPQVGAGQKENDNSFTGMLMGTVKESGKNFSEIGLLGYKSGIRTLFLNSEDGSAIFGKQGTGQIIIDPNTDKALLYSSSFWKEYNEKGKPKNYNSSNENNAGLLIDLTAPQIKFGNGNFIVDSNGHLTAKGGGQIAGFTIGDNTLIGGTGESQVGLCSKSGVAYAFWAGDEDSRQAPFRVGHNGALFSTSGNIAGWSIGEDKLSKGKVGISSNNSSDDNYAFWAGNVTAASAQFSVTFGGKLKAENATIGSGTNKITIGKSSENSAQSAIYSGSKSSYLADAAGFYIGTNGFSLGKLKNGKNPFEVSANGALRSTSGVIGGYTIDENTLTGGSGDSAVGMSSKTGTQWAFWAGNENGSLAPFHVGHDGRLYATSADIEGKITATSGSFSGKITATNGSIGGWDITNQGITGGDTWLSSGGAIGGPNWTIDENGEAVFNDITITNNKGSSSLNWGNGFKVNNQGVMTANGASFNGTVSSSTLSGNTITGGSIDITTGGNGFLRAGLTTTHVYVSGLNIDANGAGIAMNGNGISDCSGISSTGYMHIYSDNDSGNIEITGNQILLGASGGTSNILLKNSSGNYVSMTSLYVPQDGNGASLGNLWVGDNVINNDNSGGQVAINYAVSLNPASGYYAYVGGTSTSDNRIATQGWCNSNFEPRSSNFNIKENIRERDTSDIPNLIRQIKMYDYNYIKDFYDGQEDYGYIIDELEKIKGIKKYVDFIKKEYDEEDNRKKYNVKYINREHFEKFLLAAIIELQKQIDKIKGEKGLC